MGSMTDVSHLYVRFDLLDQILSFSGHICAKIVILTVFGVMS